MKSYDLNGRTASNRTRSALIDWSARPNSRATQKMKSLGKENQLVLCIVLVESCWFVCRRFPVHSSSGPKFSAPPVTAYGERVCPTIKLATCCFVNTEKAHDATERGRTYVLTNLTRRSSSDLLSLTVRFKTYYGTPCSPVLDFLTYDVI